MWGRDPKDQDQEEDDLRWDDTRQPDLDYGDDDPEPETNDDDDDDDSDD